MRFFSFVSRLAQGQSHAALSCFEAMAYVLVGLGVVALLIGGYLSALAWAVHEIDKQTSYD
jgi:hypothetical protein